MAAAKRKHSPAESHARKFFALGRAVREQVVKRYSETLQARLPELPAHARHVCSWVAHAPVDAGLLEGSPSPAELLVSYLKALDVLEDRGRSLPEELRRLLPLVALRAEDEVLRAAVAAATSGAAPEGAAAGAAAPWRPLLEAVAALSRRCPQSVACRCRRALYFVRRCSKELIFEVPLPLGAALPAERVSAFYGFVRRRERVRLRRERGCLPPWTNDPVMRRLKLTNVHRSDDRTTRAVVSALTGLERCWLAALATGVRARRRSAKRFAWNIAVWRRFGTDSFVSAVGSLSCPETEEELTAQIVSISAAAVQLWKSGFHACTDAYRPATVANRGETGAWQLGLWRLGPEQLKQLKTFRLEGYSESFSRPLRELMVTEDGAERACLLYEKLARGLRPVWEQLDAVVDAMRLEGGERSWRVLVEALKLAKGIGNFLGKELAQDLLLTPAFPSCADLESWTGIGVGGARGVNRIAGRAPRAHVPASQLLQELRYVFEQRREHWPERLMGRPTRQLTLHDLQFQACEFDKYERVWAGEGKARAFAAEACNGAGAWLSRVDSLLQSAGGRLPWRRLADDFAAGVEGERWARRLTRDEVVYRCLAALPLTYLSSDDHFVRLPEGCGRGVKRKLEEP